MLIALPLHSGCATYQPPVTVSEAERKACEELAQAEAASAKESPITARTLGFTNPDTFIVAPFVLPFAVPIILVENAQTRQRAYDYALRGCLEPVLPADVIVAHRLRNLANGYAAQGKFGEAEPLYKRALAIQEKVVAGGDSAASAEVATVLEDYAALLRKTNRDAEAEEMEAHAKAVRDTIASGTTTNP